MANKITSTALTQSLANTAIANLSADCFGITIDPSLPSYSAQQASFIRLEYPTDGEPDWGTVNDNVCFCTMTATDSPWNRMRDSQYINSNAVQLTQAITYTRVWSANWIFYGPSSLDNARNLLSYMQDSEDSDAILVQYSLSYVTDQSESNRTPENFANQWWERVNVTCTLNELVTDSLTLNQVLSVPVITDFRT